MSKERIWGPFREVFLKRSRGLSFLPIMRSMSHQLRQPLSAMAMRIQLLEEQLQENDVRDELFKDDIKILLEKIDLTSTMLDNFRDYFVRDEGDSVFLVVDLLEKNFGLLETYSYENNIELELYPYSDLKVKVPPTTYFQVVIGIFSFLVSTTSEREKILISIEETHLSFHSTEEKFKELKKSQIFDIHELIKYWGEEAVFKLFLAEEVSTYILKGKIWAEKNREINGRTFPFSLHFSVS